MEQPSSKRFIAIGSMLFALFFGAGNLIFPAAMGQSAGANVWWAVLGFCVTGVGLPLLGIIAVGYSGCRDLREVASRVHPLYGLFYTVVCYMAIGPCFAIPRTGTVSFEIAVRPFLGADPSAFALPTLIVNSVKEIGFTDPKAISSQVMKSGMLAGLLLALVYIFIAKIGAESVAAIGMQDTGAPVLAESAKVFFGSFGAYLLAAIVLLACITTAVGLLTCCAAFFMQLTGKFTYVQWVIGFTVISYLIGLFGLKTIIVSTIPVLMFIYPLCVALIALIFLHKFFGGRQCVYAWTMGFTFVMALVNGAETAGISMTGLEEVLKAYVPLHTYGMGWIPFAIVGFVIGLIWKVAVPAKAQNAAA